MKQTNNAIKFLMAQYRSIFKNAYFKGLTTAMVVTAGLVAAQGAQAEAPYFGHKNPEDWKNVSGNVTIDKNATANKTFVFDAGRTYGVNKAITEVTSNKATITFKSGAASATGNRIKADSTNGAASLTGKNVTIKLATSVADDGLLIQGGGAANKGASLDIGTFDFTKGTVLLSGSSFANDVVLSADTITLNGKSATDANIVFSGATATTANAVVLKGELITKGNGGTLDLSSGSAQLETFGKGVTADVIVGADQKAQIVLQDDPKTTNVDEGLLQFTKGIINLANKGTGTSSGGQILVSGGTLAIEGATKLITSGTASATTEVGNILVSGAATNPATLRITSNILKNFLTTNANNAVQGAVIISGTAGTNDSILEFADTEIVDLTKVNTDTPFANTNTVASGSISVSGGTIKATNLAVSKQVSTLDKASLEAETLTLGNSDWDNATGLGFADATVKNAVFLADGAFELKDDLTFSSIQSVVNPLDSKSQVNKAADGYISGDLLVTDADDNALKILAGNYTNKNDLTLSGGALKIGSGATTGEAAGVDATLVQTGKLTLDGGTVELKGNGSLAFDKKNSRDAIASLDITGAKLELGGAGDNTFDVDQGILKVTGVQISDILTINTDDDNEDYGASIVLNDAVLDINGNLQEALRYSLDVSNLVSGTSADQGQIALNGESMIKAKEIWLQEADTNSVLDIGSDSVLKADRILLDQQATKTDDKTTYADFVVDNGSLIVGSELSSANRSRGNDIVFNNGTLQLGYIDPSADDWDPTKTAASYTTSSANGNVSQNLKLTGENGRTDLKVVYGSWSVQNVAIANGLLEVGSADGEKDASGNTYKASLTSNGGLTLSKGATVQVNENGQATFNTLETDSTTRMTIHGQMTVNGKYVAEVKDDETITTPESFGVKINGGYISVDGEKAKLTFGADATKAIALNKAEGETVVSSVKVAENTLGKNNIDVINGGTLALNFANDTIFNGAGLASLRSQLISHVDPDGTLYDGFIDIGSAQIKELSPSEGFISWDNYDSQDSQFKDIIADIKTDTLSAATLTDVKADSKIAANVGNIRANSGVTAVTLDGKVTLSDASANNAASNFIFNADNPDTPLDANVLAGSNVRLLNGGHIGAVTLTGSESAQTQLYVGPAAAEDGSTTFKAINGGDYTTVHIDGTTEVGSSEVAGNVKAGELIVDQGLTVHGDTTVNSLTSSTDATTGLPVTTGSINTNNLTVSGTASFGGKITAAGDVKVGALDFFSQEVDGKEVYTKANGITANNLTVTDDARYYGDINVSGTTTFNGSDNGLLGGNNTFGNLVVTDSLWVGNSGTDATATKTTVDNLTLKQSSEGSHLNLDVDNTILSVGVLNGSGSNAALNIFVGDAAGTDDDGVAYESSTGYLMADRIDLAGGDLVVDPDFSKKASIATVKTLGKADSKDAGTLQGNVFALQNAIVAIGTERTKDADGNDVTLANVQDKFKDYINQTTGALQSGSVGSIIYVAKHLTVEDGSKLIAHSGLNVRDRDGGLNNNVPSDAYKAVMDNKADVYLGKNSALAIEVTDNQLGTIHFNKDAATIYSEEGGKIILTGDYKPTKPVYLMTDNGEGEEAGVDVASGSQTIKVQSLNGLYKFENNAEALDFAAESTIGAIQLSFDGSVIDKDPELFADTSSPVKETFKQYGALVDAGLPDDEHNPVLDYVLRPDNFYGRDAEVVARLGAFGGAAQAAIAAGSTTYEAVSGRMGVGATGANITVADNTQGAALWLSPVYKNRDSDGFGADGIDYGTDLDLYGVALGADYTLANGFKIGAAFNIGSGDADGNGAGEGVSNDFDYYGFAIYGGYTYGPYSVVADISYTNVDNDIDATIGLGKVGTSFDSSNLSVGVTGQYQAILDGDVSVTPHVGLRYTKIDLDDYEVHGENGGVAAYSSDDMSIFSIPFGVTVAKEFVNGTWTVKPSFDLTLTANMGDDSADGSVYWGDYINNTAVSNEVLDNFTYGATVGVAAKSGNFSLGFGLNYTGSSNTDEFGVNANARFVF